MPVSHKKNAVGKSFRTRTRSLFRKIDRKLLRDVATGNLRTPSLYYHQNYLLREGFWLRLRQIDWHMAALGVQGGRCLDLGGGSGVFLPTLAARFNHVTCVDMDPSGAREVVRRLELTNVEVVEADVRDASFDHPFDVIVAADVLEHFADLSLPVGRILAWLPTKGHLFTSLPTESKIYEAVRRLFGISRPDDHYHTAADVESYLNVNGFQPLRRRCLPVPMLPLFIITAWCRQDG